MGAQQQAVLAQAGSFPRHRSRSVGDPKRGLVIGDCPGVTGWRSRGLRTVRLGTPDARSASGRSRDKVSTIRRALDAFGAAGLYRSTVTALRLR